MTRPVPLVYVVSNGRSGSTLLDLLLGAHPRAWSVGELQILPFELREHRAPCGCGAALDTCDFWAPLVADRAFERGPAPLHHFRDTHGFGRVLRREHLGDLWRGRPSGRNLPRARAYGERTADLLRRAEPAATARRGAPLRWFVDASKDPYRMLWLAASPELDLRVIHLTRDPRAFVHSMTRDSARPPTRRVARYAARWTVENALMRRAVRRAVGTERSLGVRYEDLAGDPERELGRIGAWLGLEDLPEAVHTFREVENHAVSGNEMRWRGGRIRLDERWRDGLSSPARRLVELATLPVRHRFGY